MSKPVCAIFGVGPGNGMAFARKFTAAGYATALCARSTDAMAGAAADLDDARGFTCDVSDTASVTATITAITDQMGPIDTLIFNAGNARWGSVDDLAPEDLDIGFDVNAKGLMRCAQAALPSWRAAGSGTLLVVGAGAALRGRPGTLAFAASKAAQRSVAQSLARQLGPEGIHVAYLILDGVIDLERTRARMPDAPDTFYLTADGVADAALALARQDRQAWTFELDLRPFGESW
ncbi:SDR family NAD(P)-dependent oxidoreductase [Shimia sediminis]|uniref:SDR family NAD(P)-dependent oxidoreductase n=1 Tax=Shimia sediminis TaxID=2497945 RepID=UPI000F8ED6BE|nr:SDR family NAD(P)-dependent oxidoreductase [Shimia sediminis]